MEEIILSTNLKKLKVRDLANLAYYIKYEIKEDKEKKDYDRMDYLMAEICNKSKDVIVRATDETMLQLRSYIKDLFEVVAKESNYLLLSKGVEIESIIANTLTREEIGLKKLENPEYKPKERVYKVAQNLDKLPAKIANNLLDNILPKIKFDFNDWVYIPHVLSAICWGANEKKFIKSQNGLVLNEARLKHARELFIDTNAYDGLRAFAFFLKNQQDFSRKLVSHLFTKRLKISGLSHQELEKLLAKSMGGQEGLKVSQKVKAK